MDDNNSASDDEIHDTPPNSNLSSKKVKLNDGSSQDSFKLPAAACSKDENMDSGVSVDKSESTTSEDKGPSTSNDVVDGALPKNGIETFLLNVSRRGQNYRKRKTPERDTDSNSSRDSDDLSADEASMPMAPGGISSGSSETESDDNQLSVELYSSSSGGSASHLNSSSESDASIDPDDVERMLSRDTDDYITDEASGDPSDDDPNWVMNSVGSNDSEDLSRTVNLKPQPKPNFDILKELINREMGLMLPIGKGMRENLKFERGFYGSLHAVYRLKRMHKLNKHRGCVNSINFHPEGNLLVSGSDDMNIVIWNWAKNKALQTLKTGHKSNVFQSKFMYLNAGSQLNIVTCARDGQVRLVTASGCGGCARRRLCAHARPAHKLHVSAHEPHHVLSAGEDGLVMLSDVRRDHATRLFHVKENGSTIPLYSIHAHPLDPNEIIVAGRDKFIRMYDKRKSTRPVAMYSPSIFVNASGRNEMRLSMSHLTCAVFNHDGTEILGSYNNEDIYLFDKVKDAYVKDSSKTEAGYTHKYSGHRNSATFKGVSFFGPKSEFVVSGSDCAHLYVWERDSEAIVQWVRADSKGVVNCIEAHPKFPVLATSGLDRDVKIWMPNDRHGPNFSGLEKVIRNNNKSSFQSPLFNDFLPTLYDAINERISIFSDRPTESVSIPFGGNIDLEGNVCTTI